MDAAKMTILVCLESSRGIMGEFVGGIRGEITSCSQARSTAGRNVFMGMQSVLAPCSKNASLMRNSTSCISDNSAQCNPPLDRLQSPRVEYQARNSQIFPETSVRITRELDVLSGQR